MSRSPASILYDADGHPVGVVLDGSIYRLQVDAKLTAGHGLALDSSLDGLLTELQAKANLTETQPVSAASLPLPAGASTEATLALLQEKVAEIDSVEIANTTHVLVKSPQQEELLHEILGTLRHMNRRLAALCDGDDGEDDDYSHER